MQKTDGLIDDEKLHARSARTNDYSLSGSKSSKAFGPVGNCINSVHTGIPLSCHYTHHGESSTDVIKSNLSIIQGTTNPKSVELPNMMLYGDRGKSLSLFFPIKLTNFCTNDLCVQYCNAGYNDQEYFEFMAAAALSFLNTTQRGPLLPFKFGRTKYKTTRQQHRY